MNYCNNCGSELEQEIPLVKGHWRFGAFPDLTFCTFKCIKEYQAWETQLGTMQQALEVIKEIS